MFLRILKKDLARKRAMNVILFIFVALCTMFMASGVNYLAATSSGLTYFAEKTRIADYYCLAELDPGIEAWLEESGEVSGFLVEEALPLASGSPATGVSGGGRSGNDYLTKVPRTYNLILDAADEPITEIAPGTIALTYSDAHRSNLGLGDRVEISFAGAAETFTVGAITKDMLFGSANIGMGRRVISDSDFERLKARADTPLTGIYSIRTDNPAVFEQDMNRQSFRTYFNFDRQMLEGTFVMEMMTAAILMVGSVLLILIALVALGFTIRFTLQEDYREIGVMKAIGVRTRGIKMLYLIKYLGISLVGGALGVLLSFPFAALLTFGIRNNAALGAPGGEIGISILCGAAMVLVVLGFCYLTLGRIGKLRAIQALREGSSGEDFKTRRRYSLHKHPRIPVPLQMAVNDILCSAKSYVALLVVFALATFLIIAPANMATTLKSPGTIEYFGMAASDVYVSTLQEGALIASKDPDALTQELRRLQQLYEKSGIELDFHAESYYMTAIYADDPDANVSIFGVQGTGFDSRDYQIFPTGRAPCLENEIAMTKLALERVGAAVGDTVHVAVGGEVREYVVTSDFESLNMMGLTMRFAEAAPISFAHTGGILSIQGSFADRRDIEGQIEKMKAVTPDFRIQTSAEYITALSGDSVGITEGIALGTMLTVMVIVCLITVLLVRAFIARDRGGIALLQSLGFRSATLRAWQLARIMAVLLVGITVGVAASILLNAPVISATFGIMGASNLPVQIDWPLVYGLYPLILFCLASVAALLGIGTLGSGGLKHIKTME